MDATRLFKLKQDREAKLTQAQELLARSEREGRDLSRRESARYRELEREIDELTDALRQGGGGGFDPRLAQGSPFEAVRSRRVGEVTDVLSREQRMADWVRERRGLDGDEYDGEQFSLGRVMTAMVRRDRSQLTPHEQRALLEGSDAAGGFLTPELLSAEVIDRLRAKARTFQAGVQLIPMVSDQLNFARLSGGVTPSWKSEAAAITDQSMTFDRVTLTPKVLPLLVKISQELFDDLSPQAATVIEDEMLAALALELDRVILRGSGVSPEPKGILNQTGVTQQLLGPNGELMSAYQNLATAIGTVRGNNLEPTAALINAKTAAYLDKAIDATGQPVRKPPSVENLPFLVSNVIPSNLTVGSSGAVCSEAYVAQWDQVLVGMRTDIRVGIRPLLERYADNLMVGLVCYLRADVAMRHGEAAVVLTGIKTS